MRRKASRYCSDRCNWLGYARDHATYKPQVAKNCEWCHEPLPEGKYSSARRYCSRQCGWKANERKKFPIRGEVTQNCPQCGKQFSFLPQRGPQRRFCSDACRTKASIKKPTERTCPVCRQSFQTQVMGGAKYCSDTCRWVSQGKIWPHSKISFRQ